MTSRCHQRVHFPVNPKLMSLWLAALCLSLILEARAQLNVSTTSEGIEAPSNLITTQELPSTDLSTRPPSPLFELGQCPLDELEVDEDGKTIIKVGYLASSSSDSIKRFAMRIGGAMTEAVNAVNYDKDLLPGYKLKYVWTNTGHTERESIRALTEQWKSGVVAFFGPNPTCSIEAKIVSAWELPMLSATNVNEGFDTIVASASNSKVTSNLPFVAIALDTIQTCAESKLSDKSIYPTFARTIPTDDLLTEAVSVLLEHFNWYNVSIVSSSESNRLSVSESLRLKLPTKGIHINDVKVYASPYIPPKYSDPSVEPEMRTIVRETYEHTRIYIFSGELWEVYELLNEMMYHGLLENGEYMVIWANQETYDSKQIHLFQGDPYSRKPSRNVIMYYRTLLALFLSPATDPSYKDFKRRAYNRLSDEPFNFDFGEDVNPEGIPIEATYLYDNVYNVYAPALNETLAEGYDIRNGTEIMKRILCRKHASITGRAKYIDARGDAYADITVIALKMLDDVNHTFGYIMHPVATIKITNSTPAVERLCLGNGTSFQWVYEPINGTSIPWVSGNVPLAVPKCGFYGEFCDTPYRPIVEIVAGVVGGLLLIILIVAITVYRNWKYEQELASLLWKIDYADIQTKRHNGSTISAISKLSLMTTDSKNSVDPYRCQIFTEVGTYKNMLVAIKKIHKRHVDLTRSVRKELKIMRDLRHPHLNQFIGACVDPPNICTITEYCPKGSLQDILENDEVKLDSMFIASLIGDILKGLSCLHASETHSHGNLKSSNCVVDSRWVLKITDFGLHQFRSGSNTPEIGEHAKYEKLLWRAPELLRDPAPRPEGTQKGDMYSLGIILYEMATRQGPYGKCVLGPKEIVDKVTHPLDPNTPFRPNVMEVEDCPGCMLTGMQECWRENQDERPDVKTLTTRLKPLQKGMKPNILDNMIVIMEKYANNLEDIVEDRTHQLLEEKKKTDNLLHQMLPKPVANQLKRGMQVVPESFECVTIFFSDIVGFTSLSSESTPFEVVDMLNDLYTLFDEIISYYDVYKVETIGDAYMLVSGLPLRNEKKHAAEIASTSLHLLDAVKVFKVRHRPEVNLKLRIGIHSGPTVAGVVGLTMPRYCLFGDTVNTSSRMESNGEALKIHTSSETKNLLEQMGGFVVEERGLISMKGKGQLVTYWLMSAHPSYRRSSPFRTAEENATVGLFDSPHGNHANRHSKINAQPQKEPFTKRLEADGRPANPNVCRDVMKTFPDQTGVERQRPHSMFAPGSHGGTPNHFPNSALIDFSHLNNSNENSPKVTDRLLGHNERSDSGSEPKLDLSSCTNSLLDKRQRLNDSALDFSSRNSNSHIKEGLLENEVETVV